MTKLPEKGSLKAMMLKSAAAVATISGKRETSSEFVPPTVPEERNVAGSLGPRQNEHTMSDVELHDSSGKRFRSDVYRAKGPGIPGGRS